MDAVQKKIYTPSHVANFILERAEKENINITQLKLLKLVYLMYGWVLAVLDEKLFDEEFQAWQYGPVIVSLYHEFKRFEDNPITDRSMYMDEDRNTFIPHISNDDDEIITVMEKAWDVYKLFKASALVSKTHEPNSPWEKTFEFNKNNNSNKSITDEEIKEYFIEKIGLYLHGIS